MNNFLEKARQEWREQQSEREEKCAHILVEDFSDKRSCDDCGKDFDYAPDELPRRWKSGGKFEERGYIKSPDEIEEFLKEIAAVCRRHNLSIAHEDGHGGFLIENFSESCMSWLLDASDNR